MTKLMTTDPTTSSAIISRQSQVAVTPQIKYVVSSAAERKKITWPIVCDSDGLVFFAPLGRYGAQYFIPDVATRDRIALRSMLITQRYWITVSLFNLASTIYSANGASHYHQVIAGTVTSCLIPPALFPFAVWHLFRQSRGLTVAAKRPPFRQSCRLFANNFEPIVIYVVQAIAVGLAALGVWSLQCPTPVIRGVATAMSSALLACSVGITLACCWLLSLRSE